MERDDQGRIYLEGEDSAIWSQPDINDLLVLKGRGDEVWLSRWIEDKVVRWFYKLRRGRQPLVRSPFPNPV